jgi:hypothetical protein
VLQSSSSTKGRLGKPCAPGSTPASQTTVLPRWVITQQDRPTSCPAPSIWTWRLSESDAGSVGRGGEGARFRRGGMKGEREDRKRRSSSLRVRKGSAGRRSFRATENVYERTKTKTELEITYNGLKYTNKPALIHSASRVLLRTRIALPFIRSPDRCSIRMRTLVHAVHFDLINITHTHANEHKNRKRRTERRGKKKSTDRKGARTSGLAREGK